MFSELDSLVSVTCSILALGSTGYFWWVRSNQERPSMSVYCCKPMVGAVLMPQEDYYPFQQLVELKDGHWARYSARLVVCNQSILANSIVALRTEVCSSEGKWEAAHFRLPPEGPNSGEVRDFPITVGGTSTTIVDGVLYLPVSERGSTRDDRERIAAARLHKNQRLRIDLHCTEGGRFQLSVDVSPVAADPLVRPING